MKFSVLVLMIFVAYCSNSEKQETMKFSNGTMAHFAIAYDINPNKENEMIVTYRNEAEHLKTNEVEDQIQQLFNRVKPEAEKAGVENIMINYEHRSGYDEEHKRPVYEVLIAEASLKEDGNWDLTRANF